MSFLKLLEQATCAVVINETKKSSGTAWLFKISGSTGYLMTAAHVVACNSERTSFHKEVQVRFDSDSHRPTLDATVSTVKYNKEWRIDFAILTVKNLPEEYKPLPCQLIEQPEREDTLKILLIVASSTRVRVLNS